MLFSKQVIHCSNCGIEMFVVITNAKQCCSKECLEDLEWKRALSIMGKEYYPKPIKVNG